MGKNTDSKKSKAGEPAAEEPKSGFQISAEPVVHGEIEENAHKYEATTEAVSVPGEGEIGELPASYGENTLFLVARDPSWLFSYWDVNWSAISASSMKDGEFKVYLKLFANGNEESTTLVNPHARNWYLQVESPGATYSAELGYYGVSGDWESIVRSAETSTPSATIGAESSGDDFATVPFHITFERLLEMVKSTMREGESLIEAINRLQSEGAKLAFGTGKAPNWTDDQKQILAALLGEEAVSQLAMGSADIDQLLRKHLAERLNTESASELAAKGRLSELFGPGESSLFSALGGASLFSALGGASLFSGVGASWSAQPFGAEKPGGFFMHVNAEVVFYGGTHPDAKVTVDGNPIRLKPDGSFHYHFKLPDGKFEIPIVAVSPDGVEKRSATLTFERSTAREGEVGSTNQPSFLGEPMGRKS